MILTPSWFNLFRLQFTVLGYYVVNTVLTFMEMIRLAPKGSGKVRVRVRVRDRVRIRVRVSDPPRAQGQRQGARAATSGSTHARHERRNPYAA